MLRKYFTPKKPTPKKRTIENFQDSDGLDIDSENPELNEGDVFGTVPQSVSLMLNSKAQLRGATTNLKDKLKEEPQDGAPKVTIKSLQIVPDSADIETMLNEHINTKIDEALAAGTSLEEIKKNLKSSIKSMKSDTEDEIKNNNIQDQLGFDLTADDINKNPKFAQKIAMSVVSNKKIAAKLGVNSTTEQIKQDPEESMRIARLVIANTEIKTKLGVRVTKADLKANPALSTSMIASDLGSMFLKKQYGIDVNPEELLKNPQYAAKMAGEILQNNAVNIALQSSGLGAINIKNFMKDPGGTAKDYIITQVKKKVKQVAMGYAKKAIKYVVEKTIEKAIQMGQDLAAQMGQQQAEAMMDTVVEAQVEDIGENIAVSEVQGQAAGASGLFIVTILVRAMTFAAMGLKIGMTVKLRGETGWCPPDHHRVTDDWPWWATTILGSVPGIGKLLTTMFTYMCFKEKCENNEDKDGGLCYPKCDGGYKGVGPLCWSEYESIGVGVLRGCPPNWVDDGLICREPITMDPCPPNWNDDGLLCRAPLTYKPCPNGYNSVGVPGADVLCANKVPGHLEYEPCATGTTADAAQSCWASEPAELLGIAYTRSWIDKWAVDRKQWWEGGDTIVRELDSMGQVEAKVSHGGLLIGKMNLDSDGGNRLACPADHPDYIDGLCYRSCPVKSQTPSVITKQVPKWIRNRPTPLTDTAKAALDSAKNSDYTDTDTLNQLQKELGDAMEADAKEPIPDGTPYKLNPEWVKEANKGPNYTATPPDPSMEDYKIESLAVQVQIPSSVQLVHAPGAPYQCVGTHGISYGRGAGRPAVTMVLQDVKPPRRPPPINMSSYYAEDPETDCYINYASKKTMGDMCEFYYQSSSTAAKVVGITKTFETITKITGVIASSEQSADVLCEISELTINIDTGEVINTRISKPSTDRRFYFAKISTLCTFFVCGCTNIDDTAPDVKKTDGTVKVVDFTPTVVKCANIMMTKAKCTNETNVKVMMALYNKSFPDAKVQTIDAADATGATECTLVWTEMDGSKKAGDFDYKKNSDCTFKITKYTDVDPYETTVSPLETPIVINAPLAAEVSLDGCPDTNCRDAVLIQRMINVYNNKTGNKIQSITKSITPEPLRCEVEAKILMKDTKKSKVGTIAFDLVKPSPNLCIFNVSHIGKIGSGTNISKNTPALEKMINPESISIITKAVKSTVDALGLKTKEVTDVVGQANQLHDATISNLGQTQTLGNCNNKCTDSDVLAAITTHYNNKNYPSTRTNVTKKVMKSILKAGTASATECDITFEETQEDYSDLYDSEPYVTTTTKTQRFTMGDTNGDCVFNVVKAPPKEGFSNHSSGFQGLPGVKSVSGFQSGSTNFKTPSTVNSVTPALNPPYTNTGCELKCEDPNNIVAMKMSINRSKTDGFTNRVMSGFSSLSEAFQVSPLNQTIPNTASLVATAPTPKVITSTTFKKVNRALKVNTTTCEYEVVYDATNMDTNGNSTHVKNAVGYYQATFTKDPSACTFTVSSAAKSSAPILPSVPVKKSVALKYTF